jgi:hypothetical protein
MTSDGDRAAPATGPRACDQHRPVSAIPASLRTPPLDSLR